MKLTTATIKGLTLPAGKKDAIFFDEQLRGFGIRIRAGGTRVYAALDNDEPRAIQMAMRNQFNWDAGRGGFGGIGVPALLDGGEKPRTSVDVVFVVPGRREEPARPLPGWEPTPGPKLLPPPTQKPIVRRNAWGDWEEVKQE